MLIAYYITHLSLLLIIDCKEMPNGWRYRQARELAGRAARRRIRCWVQSPESAANARTYPVHAVLGALQITGRDWAKHMIATSKANPSILHFVC